HLCLHRDLRESRLWSWIGGGDHWRADHPRRRLDHVQGGRPADRRVAMRAETTPVPARATASLLPAARAALMLLVVAAILLLFLPPVAILVVTSLRPGWAVYYIYRGTAFTLQNYLDVFARPAVVRAFANSFVLATLATLISLGITVTSGYMLSRFSGPIP